MHNSPFSIPPSLFSIQFWQADSGIMYSQHATVRSFVAEWVIRVPPLPVNPVVGAAVQCIYLSSVAFEWCFVRTYREAAQSASVRGNAPAGSPSRENKVQVYQVGELKS